MAGRDEDSGGCASGVRLGALPDQADVHAWPSRGRRLLGSLPWCQHNYGGTATILTAMAAGSGVGTGGECPGQDSLVLGADWTILCQICVRSEVLGKGGHSLRGVNVEIASPVSM